MRLRDYLKRLTRAAKSWRSSLNRSSGAGPLRRVTVSMRTASAKGDDRRSAEDDVTSFALGGPKWSLPRRRTREAAAPDDSEHCKHHLIRVGR